MRRFMHTETNKKQSIPTTAPQSNANACITSWFGSRIFFRHLYQRRHNHFVAGLLQNCHPSMVEALFKM